MPPSELSVHPADENGSQELYLMCDDIKSFVTEMAKHNINCSELQDQVWGILTQLQLPGRGTLGVYQPKHERPQPM